MSLLGEVSETLYDLETSIDEALVLANPRQKDTDWSFFIEKDNVINRITSLNSISSVANLALDALDLVVMKFKIRNISFPRLKLITQKTKWGTNPFVSFEHPEVMHMTIEEDIFFNTMNYFQEWLDGMFDSETNTFKSVSDRSEIYRQGVLTMGTPVPLIGVTGKTIKISNMKFLGFEPMTLIHNGEDCVVYLLTFSIEKVSSVGLEPKSLLKSLL